MVSKYYYMTVEDCNIIGGSQLCWYLPNVAHRTSTIIVWWYFFYLEREGSLCIDTTFLQLRNNRAQKTIQSIHKRSKHHPTTSDMAWAICGFEYNLLQSSGGTDVVHDNDWSTHVRFNHWPGLWRDPCWLGFQIIWNNSNPSEMEIAPPCTNHCSNFLS